MRWSCRRPGGLWSYLLGDTVRFTRRDPLRLAITGRTRHYVNAFGENVIVEEIERALVGACRRTEAEVVEFTVAPSYPTAGEPRGGHEWLVEFRDSAAGARRVRAHPRRDADRAQRRLPDEAGGRRGHGRADVTALPAGTFHRWMRAGGKLGDQHKVPRVTNDRAIAEALLALAPGLGSPSLAEAAV